MQKINFNDNWLFTLDSSLDAYNAYGFGKYAEAKGAGARFYDYANWQKVTLPHDWAVSMPKETEGNTSTGARLITHYMRYMTEEKTDLPGVENIGWYRKDFKLGEEYIGKRVFLELEGVFRDSIVWVNGAYIDRHTSGYTGIVYDITDHLYFDEDNSIAVRVDSEQFEGWWYEGAGIYRNVNLYVAEPVYFKIHNAFVKSTTDGAVSASAILVNDTDSDVCESITATVKNKNGYTVCRESIIVSASPYSETEFSVSLNIENPILWDIDNPYLYTLTFNGSDELSVKFGVREFRFDPDLGFFLNGKSVKLNGACVHQDLGGVGVALTDNLQYYKISMLKKMGVNAYRCSHNPPAPALLDACDELGMLVMDEVRMFSTSPEGTRQLVNLILRDRNHPSVILWSVGNEDFTVHDSKKSSEIAAKMCRIIKSLDDTRPTTYGGCNGPNFIGANGAVDIRGINYIRNGPRGWVDEYHKDHPTQPMLGSEETSYVLSRGEAKNNFGMGVIDCTGDVTMPWASTPKGWMKFYNERPYLAGGFMWTGFDYHGEPNPFCYTNYSSSFGTIDLCGIPKPPFYYYKSQWIDEPVLKILPHWNYSEGEEAMVLVYTNCDSVTISLNGRKIGEYSVLPMEFIKVSLPFEAGTVTATGMRGGVEYTDSITTSGDTSALTVRDELLANNIGDIGIVEIAGVDNAGVFCPLASDEIYIEAADGEIVGVCNGDPADPYFEQLTAKEEYFELKNFEHNGENYKIAPKAKNTKFIRRDYLEYEPADEYFCDDYRVIACFSGDTRPSEKHEYTTVFNCDSSMQYIEIERIGSVAEIYLNGKKIGDNIRSDRDDSIKHNRPYRFYADFKNGKNEIKILATLPGGSVDPFSGYVRVGKTVKPGYTVKLHYGLARVFVRNTTAKGLRIGLKK